MKELYGPPCPWRSGGVTPAAFHYPLSPAGLEIIAEHNRCRVDQLPRVARYSSGPYMHDWIERLGAARRSGMVVHTGKRWLLPRELPELEAA